MANQTTVDIDQCNCFALRKAARQISRLYDAHLDPTGLRITQFLILASLNETRSASVNELSERLDIERTAMGKMVALLEGGGLVSVEQSPVDRRMRIVLLTEEGARLFARAEPMWQEAQRKFAQLNGVSNVDSLRTRLGTMKVGNVVDMKEASARHASKVKST